MRGLLGGLLGGKGGTRALLQDLLRSLANDGVQEEVWQKCLAAKDFEDVLDDEIDNKNLATVIADCPGNALGLVIFCLEAIEAALALDTSSFDDKADISLVNSTLLLTHLLAAELQSTDSKRQQPRSHGSVSSKLTESTLRSRLWDPVPGETPLPAVGERVANAAMRILFLEGFTIDETDGKDESDQAGSDGVDPAFLWLEGVGPEGATQSRPDNDMRANRELGLQLLVAMLCGAPAGSSESEEKPAKKAAAGPVRASTADPSMPLIADSRPLAYLSNPESPVPFRPELLYSLMSTALSYDPRGYGVPYAGYFAGDKEESYATLCLQTLGLLLQDSVDMQVEESSAVIAWHPQQEWNDPRAETRLQPSLMRPGGAHVFRDLLAGISSERELTFLVSSIINLLGTLGDERSTYLPNSMRPPDFLPELLILVFHLAACSDFVQSLNEQGEMAALVEGALHVASQAPDHLSEELVGLLAGAVLLRLTSYREICAALNDDFEGDMPDGLPEFDGTVGDLVALAALRQVADHLGAAVAGSIHRALVEVHICILDNISTFSEGLAMETCFRLFSLLERCAKSVQVKQDKTGVGVWLPRLLEAFMNVLQYQYGLNSNLVYGLMTRRTLLADLATSVTSIRAQTATASAGTQHEQEQAAKVADAETEANPCMQPSSSTVCPLTECWGESEEYLRPLLRLLESIVPKLEAEVERRDISTPEEAKELIPRSVLGLLPVPHAFVMRSLRYSRRTHQACEECLVACLKLGPLEALWDMEDRGRGAADAGSTGAASVPGKQAASAADRRSRSIGARERSASARRRPSISARDRSASRGPRGARAAPSSGARPPPADSSNAGNSALIAQLEAAAKEGVDLVALARQLQGQQAEPAGHPDKAGSEAAPAKAAAAQEPQGPASPVESS